MMKKRIHNPKTGKYYKIRQKTTSKGKRGQIKGTFKFKSVERAGRDFGSAIRRLSTK
ncbi:MAG: hypothetical protein ABIE43_04395 [Patescibacteria group bacterium]